MQKAGTLRETLESQQKNRTQEDYTSFREQPSGATDIPALSAPRGRRSVLNNVRASPLTVQTNPVLLPHQGSAARQARLDLKEKELVMPNPAQRQLAAHGGERRDGTMSKGNTKGTKAGPDTAMWLSSFRPQSVPPSRFSSGSRPASALDHRGSHDVQHKRSSSRDKHGDIPRDPEIASAALLDE